MNSLVLLIIIVSAVWVYIDAKSIGAEKGKLTGLGNMGPLSWALCVLLLWIISFPLYLIKRSDIKAAAANEPTEKVVDVPQSTLNKVCKYIAILWTLFCVICVIWGLISAGAAFDTSNDYELAGAAIGTSIGLSIWFFVWIFITLPAVIIFMVTKKSGPVTVIPHEDPKGATKKCPYCAETIKKEASYCRFCNQSISDRSVNNDKEASKQVSHKILSRADQPAKPKKNWTVIARQHLKNGNYKEAILAYSSAIKNSPSGQLHYERAVAYSKMKDKNKMRIDLQKAAHLGFQKAKDALSKMA